MWGTAHFRGTDKTDRLDWVPVWIDDATDNVLARDEVADRIMTILNRRSKPPVAVTVERIDPGYPPEVELPSGGGPSFFIGPAR